MLIKQRVPPPLGSKKVVLKFRSVKSMEMPPAKTGKESISSTAVITTDQINNGIKSSFIHFGRIFKTVEIKLIAPKMEETPARCKLKIAKSTEEPEWNKFPARGGYTVQPVPTPIPEKADVVKRKREGGNNQNLMLFIRGKDMSCAPTIIGISQLPKPPIIIGMTIKKL